MTTTEINRRLALAIGYAPEDVALSQCRVFVWRQSPISFVRTWLEFDHKDWRTIGPIMERYRMFPEWWCEVGKWCIDRGDFVLADAGARTCAALSVIEAHERGLL
jgi:hypothetical protein